ncbi:MAG: hypothetical protein AB1568_02180 [Thermodesulfobacteriota bacterium]
MKLHLFMVALFFVAGIAAACGQERRGQEGAMMQVRVVSLERCAATPSTIALVKETAAELGIAIDFTHVIVRSPEEAAEYRHIGSPTVQINGLDIDPEARDVVQFGIT